MYSCFKCIFNSCPSAIWFFISIDLIHEVVLLYLFGGWGRIFILVGCDLVGLSRNWGTFREKWLWLVKCKWKFSAGMAFIFLGWFLFGPIWSWEDFFSTLIGVAHLTFCDTHSGEKKGEYLAQYFDTSTICCIRKGKEDVEHWCGSYFGRCLLPHWVNTELFGDQRTLIWMLHDRCRMLLS